MKPLEITTISMIEYNKNILRKLGKYYILSNQIKYISFHRFHSRKVQNEGH